MTRPASGSAASGPGTLGGSVERPAVFFADGAEWRAWLEAHHDSAPEIWMGLHKKHVRPRGLTWEDAVPEALCFGWIDSKSEGIDEDSRRQRWTPRRKGSTWSRINVEAVERLKAEGRMTPAGLTAYEGRREDRTGTYSFEQGDLALPEVYAVRLAANPRAAAFWAAATPGYRKICTHWVLSAKQDKTRESRLTSLIEDSASGMMIKSQRYGDQPGWVLRAAAAARAVADASSPRE